MSSIAAPVVPRILARIAPTHEENGIHQWGCPALDRDVDAAGHDIKRPDQRDEADVFMQCRAEDFRIVQHKKIVAGRHRPEAECDLGVMPQPPFWREDGSGRHRA